MSALPLPVPEEAPNLEAAIRELIDAGEGDPVKIARALRARYGAMWWGREVLARSEEFVAELARRRIGVGRRGSIALIRAGDLNEREVTAQVMKEDMWVPTPFFRWIKIAEATAEDHRSRYEFEMRMAYTTAQHGTWHLLVAGLMEAEGAATTGQMKAPLPPLPEGPFELTP